jgi:hypothetical protein
MLTCAVVRVNIITVTTNLLPSNHPALLVTHKRYISALVLERIARKGQISENYTLHWNKRVVNMLERVI